jgi:sugar lactone lactonase YvrE
VQVKSTGGASVFTITGLAQAISYPAALAFDEAGNLYIADYGNGRIVKVTPAGAGTVVAAGSYVFGASTITGVAVDPRGNVYIADRSNNRVIKVAPSGAASSVSVTGLTLSSPQGVAADGTGNVYIADSGHRRVIELTAAGIASVVQTPGQTIGTLLFAVTPDSNGNLVVADWANNRVLMVNRATSALSFASTGVGATSSDSPKTATVTNLGNDELVFSAATAYTADFPENTSDSDLCASSTTLQPGEACDVSVLFTPQSAGTLSANVVVTNNHLNGSDATQNVAVSGTGAKGSPAIELDSSANPALLANRVTLTAVISSSASTPTGSVGFYDGTTLLGSETLVSGTATYFASNLAAGTHSMTAVYAGDSNYLSVTSSALSQVVSDLNLEIASGGSNRATVSAGGTATYHLTIAPSSGSVLPAAVNLSASGGPAGSTITITPHSIAAGSAATRVTVSVQVPVAAAAAGVRKIQGWALGFAFPLIGILVLPFGTEGKRRSRATLLFIVCWESCCYRPEQSWDAEEIRLLRRNGRRLTTT